MTWVLLPDKEEFTHCGLNCKVILNRDGPHYCGYVQLPEDMTIQKWEHNKDSIDVWGGITYGPNSDRWVGFDDGHAHSISDFREGIARDLMIEETRHLAKQIDQLKDYSPAVR